MILTVESFQLIIKNFFFFSSRRRHTRWPRDWSSDVCSSDLDTGCQAALLAGRLRQLLLALLQHLFVEGVRLVQGEDLGLAVEPMAIGGQFLPHRAIGRHRIFRGPLDQMQQHATALDVAEEACAEPGALAGALDHVGDSCQHEFLVVHPRAPTFRVQRAEGVVGDLGAGAGDAGQESGVAGVGQADQARIGDQLEAEPDPALFSGPAWIRTPGRAVRRGLEVRIAEAAVAAFCQHDPLAHLRQIGEQRFLVLGEDLGAARHLDRQRLARRSRALAPGAVASPLGLEVLGIAEVDQGVEALDGLRDDVPAAPAVAPVGPTELDVLFAPKGAGASTAVAAADVDLGLVEEFHLDLPGRVALDFPTIEEKRSKKKGEWRAIPPFRDASKLCCQRAPYSAASLTGLGTTETWVRPPARVLNSTRPSIRA